MAGAVTVPIEKGRERKRHFPRAPSRFWRFPKISLTCRPRRCSSHVSATMFEAYAVHKAPESVLAKAPMQGDAPSYPRMLVARAGPYTSKATQTHAERTGPAKPPQKSSKSHATNSIVRAQRTRPQN